MILGISWVRLSIRFDPGAGISGRWMASAAPSSKRRDMRVLKAFRSDPMIMRFMTRKMTVPRRIVKIEDEGLTRRGLVLRGCPKGGLFRKTPYDRIEEGRETVKKYWRIYSPRSGPDVAERRKRVRHERVPRGDFTWYEVRSTFCRFRVIQGSWF